MPVQPGVIVQARIVNYMWEVQEFVQFMVGFPWAAKTMRGSGCKHDWFWDKPMGIDSLAITHYRIKRPRGMDLLEEEMLANVNPTDTLQTMG